MFFSSTNGVYMQMQCCGGILTSFLWTFVWLPVGKVFFYRFGRKNSAAAQRRALRSRDGVQSFRTKKFFFPVNWSDLITFVDTQISPCSITMKMGFCHPYTFKQILEKITSWTKTVSKDKALHSKLPRDLPWNTLSQRQLETNWWETQPTDLDSGDANRPDKPVTSNWK